MVTKVRIVVKNGGVITCFGKFIRFALLVGSLFLVLGFISGCESESEKTRKKLENEKAQIELDKTRLELAAQNARIEEERKRKEQEERERQEQARREQLQKERRAKAYDFANRSKGLIDKLYHGGQNKNAELTEWDYLEASDTYRLKLSLTWDGAVFSSNHYACDGTLSIKSDGSNPEWNVSWMSNATKETLSNIQWMAAGAEIASALSK